MERPAFLEEQHENGQTIVSDFRKLTREEAADVDRWLLWAQSYGSMTWQEQRLFDWINEHGDDDEDELTDEAVYGPWGAPYPPTAA